MVRSYTQPSTGPPTAIQAHQTLPLPPDNNPQEVRTDSANIQGNKDTSCNFGLFPEYDFLRDLIKIGEVTTGKGKNKDHGEAEAEDEEKHKRMRTPTTTTKSEEFAAGNTRTHTNNTHMMDGDAERAWTVVVPVVVGAWAAGAKHNNSKRTPPGTSIRWVEASEASKEEEDDSNDVDDENGLGSSPRPLKPTLTNLIASNK
eukprot:jgi/Psemu1/1740/gm1.1740_g